MDDEQLYRRAYLREKAARKEAEIILEHKTRALFDSNLELKAANAQLRAHQRQMVKTEKLAALGELAAGVAHEINNPLAFVLSNLNALNRHGKKLIEVALQASKIVDSQFCSLADKESVLLCQMLSEIDINYIANDSQLIFSEVDEGLERVKDIVANLRSFARTQPGDREEVNVTAALESALKIIHNQTKYHCLLAVDMAIESCLRGNTNELIQVFINIVLNAAQAIRKQGNIKIVGREQEKNIVITITDDGIGIPAENLGKVFDPFFTAKPMGEGTGLGLSVSYGIIKSLCGTITVDSEESVGTTFTISLPKEQRGEARF